MKTDPAKTEPAKSEAPIAGPETSSQKPASDLGEQTPPLPLPLPLPPTPTPPHSYPKIVTIKHRHSDNQKLIRFLRSLSNLVFFGGSLAGLIVLIYQKYLFPKLKIKTEILKLVRLSTTCTYEKLLAQLHGLVRSNTNMYQSPMLKNVQTADDEARIEPADRKADAKGQQAKATDMSRPSLSTTTEGKSTEDRAQDGGPDGPPAIIDTPAASSASSASSDRWGPAAAPEAPSRTPFNAPIIECLGQIAARLKERGRGGGWAPSEADGAEDIESSAGRAPTRHAQTAGRVKESLRAIDHALGQQADLMSAAHQKLSAAAPLRSCAIDPWNTFSAAPHSLDSDPLFQALSLLKSQIRDLKGSLLNRRKFY